MIGETGCEGIRLGGHDHVGEAFQDFQRALKALTNRGIQLAIVSKNDEAVAMEALDGHPEMVLRRNDFAGWRINWRDKAANVADLVSDLHLALDAAVFIDNNPAERERIRTAYPDILVPEWPADPTAYVTALRHLDCFETGSISVEDRKRTEMYVAERERRDVRNMAESNDDWLRKLDTRLLVAPVSAINIARVAQLFNKTNQLNLSTRRLSDKVVSNLKCNRGLKMSLGNWHGKKHRWDVPIGKTLRTFPWERSPSDGTSSYTGRARSHSAIAASGSRTEGNCESRGALPFDDQPRVATQQHGWCVLRHPSPMEGRATAPGTPAHAKNGRSPDQRGRS